MKIEQNPFSIYDFLGYLIPGILFVFGLIFFIKVDFCKAPTLPINDVKIDQYVVLLFLCYLAGHLLSYLSSISLEFYSIWSLGFPSRYLLGYSIPGFWGNLFKKGKRNIIICIAKILMCIYIFPAVITDLFIRKILRTTSILGKAIDKASSNLINDKILNFIVKNFDTGKIESKEKLEKPIDFFRFIYHYTSEKSTVHFGKMQNYVALYGFTRTVCFTSITLLWVLIVQLVFFGYQGYMASYIIGLLIISGVLYIDFNKLYRKFSLEALMAFSVIYDMKDDSGKA